MLFGKVAYVMKGAAAGQEVELDWAARAEFVFDDDAAAATGEPRMRYYQVYLVSHFPSPTQTIWRGKS